MRYIVNFLSQVIPRFSRNTKVHCRIHKSLYSFPVLPLLKPIHYPTLPSKTYFNTVHPSILMPSECPISFRITNKKIVPIFRLPRARFMDVSIHISWCTVLNYIWCDVNLWDPIPCSKPTPPPPCSSPNVRPKFVHIQNSRAVSVLIFLIFTCVPQEWLISRFCITVGISP
jgi:hypothetical protein